MKKLLLTALLGLTAMSGRSESTITVGNQLFYADTLLHVTVGPGMQTTGVRLTGAESANASVKTNIFYTSIDLDNPNLVLTGVQALDRERGSENLLKMGERKNNTTDGLRYIAGVNGDHANLNGEAKRTNGITYIDGLLYNCGIGDAGWKMFESYVTVRDNNVLSVGCSVSMSLTLKFPSNRKYNIAFNRARNENDLVIYTPEYGTSTKTNPWGKECQLKIVEGSIIGCDAVFEVVSDPIGGQEGDGNMTIPADGCVLSGIGMVSNWISNLKVGDRLEMQQPKFTVDRAKPTDLTTIIGGCPTIVDNKEPIATARCEALNKSTAIQLTPTARTAVGLDETARKAYLVVADYYKSNECTTGFKASYGNTSTGMRFESLAEFMVYLGCNAATAMDGGGSSQLYNIGLGICNIPYGLASYLRPVANGFFAADDSPADNKVAYIEVRQKNVKLSSGQSFTPTVYGYNQYGVLVDTDIKDFTISADPAAGTVSDGVFTASSASCTTVATVTSGDIKCGVRLIINGGKDLIGGDREANIEVVPPYLSTTPAGVADAVADESDVPCTYYNLQGIAVKSPSRGVFIERQGKQSRLTVVP